VVWPGSQTHLRMASRLLDSGFADGAVFHTYHAYECVLSALIAANGYPVPPDGKIPSVSPTGKRVFGYPYPKGILLEPSTHKVRQIFFMELADKSKPYYAQHLNLSRFIRLNDRMDSLYYDAVRDQLPYDVYSRSFAVGAIPQIHLFAREVWKEIR
jgi:HEPN domain-containing protein